MVVTDVPVVLEEGSPSAAGGKPLIPQRTVTLVLVSSVNDVSVRAVNYARTLDAAVTRAVYFDLDPEAAHSIGEAWFDVIEGVPLDIVEAPFRDLSMPMLEEVRRYTRRPDTIVNVVIPEFIVARWWQLPLHNQTALFVKRLFLFEERVLVTSVAHRLESPSCLGSFGRCRARCPRRRLRALMATRVAGAWWCESALARAAGCGTVDAGVESHREANRT